MIKKTAEEPCQNDEIDWKNDENQYYRQNYRKYSKCTEKKSTHIISFFRRHQKILVAAVYYLSINKYIYIYIMYHISYNVYV